MFQTQQQIHNLVAEKFPRDFRIKNLTVVEDILIIDVDERLNLSALKDFEAELSEKLSPKIIWYYSKELRFRLTFPEGLE